MPELPPEVDTSRPHPARMYDYFLGGKNHFAADREMRRQGASRPRRPSGTARGRTGRSSAGRSGTWPRRRASGSSSTSGPGCRPPDNVHEVAQAVRRRPAWCTRTTTRWCSRTRGRCSPPPRQGRTAYIQADLREPEAILASRGGARGAGLQPAGRADHRRGPALRPGRVQARGDAWRRSSTRCRLAATWSPRTSPGSTTAGRGGRGHPRLPRVRIRLQLRDSDEFARLAFAGLELVPPGVVLVSEWRPEGDGPAPGARRGELLRRGRPQAVTVFLAAPAALLFLAATAAFSRRRRVTAAVRKPVHGAGPHCRFKQY